MATNMASSPAAAIYIQNCRTNQTIAITTQPDTSKNKQSVPNGCVSG